MPVRLLLRLRRAGRYPTTVPAGLQAACSLPSGVQSVPWCSDSPSCDALVLLLHGDSIPYHLAKRSHRYARGRTSAT